MAPLLFVLYTCNIFSTDCNCFSSEMLDHNRVCGAQNWNNSLRVKRSTPCVFSWKSKLIGISLSKAKLNVQLSWFKSWNVYIYLCMYTNKSCALIKQYSELNWVKNLNICINPHNSNKKNHHSNILTFIPFKWKICKLGVTIKYYSVYKYANI